MNANELADYLDNNVEAMLMSEQPHLDQAATMLRQQADRIESLERDGKILMQHIADMNEEKNKLRYQKAYIVQLESVLESSIELNKAQAERHKRNEQ
jgi:ArsR family metal-binding transcriptional regulator